MRVAGERRLRDDVQAHARNGRVATEHVTMPDTRTLVVILTMPAGSLPNWEHHVDDQQIGEDRDEHDLTDLSLPHG